MTAAPLAPDVLAMPHIAALCRALDAGDDDEMTLIALADAIEEAGEGELAAGLRGAVRPVCLDGCWYWTSLPKSPATGYSSRSSAFLALAAALARPRGAGEWRSFLSLRASRPRM